MWVKYILIIMVYIHETTRILKNGQSVVYLYLAHNGTKEWYDSKEWMIPLGRKETRSQN